LRSERGTPSRERPGKLGRPSPTLSAASEATADARPPYGLHTDPSWILPLGSVCARPPAGLNVRGSETGRPRASKPLTRFQRQRRRSFERNRFEFEHEAGRLLVDC
jgi:hypothetical protein